MKILKESMSGYISIRLQTSEQRKLPETEENII